MSRPKDAHDMLGVMQVAENKLLHQSVMPTGAAAPGYLEQLHASIMRNRPEIAPGKFKLEPNQAGNSYFVRPELVRGTLIAGSMRLQEVPEGLSRAILAMFLVAEVHPFADGNGRMSRLAMNSELSRVGQSRIIVPTLVREEFFDTLRVLSRGADPKPLVDFMQRMQRWTAKFQYDSLESAIAALELCNAMQESPTRFKLLEPA